MWGNRPKIGITGPDIGGAAAWLFTSVSIILAGGWPVRIRPEKPKSLDKLHGLIIGGGADVNPQTYEEEKFLDAYLNQVWERKYEPFLLRVKRFIRRLFYPLVYMIRRLLSRPKFGLDKARDVLEFRLLDEAVKRNLPILGICRGAQLINIYFKGDLHRDIQSFYTESINKASILPVKKVKLRRSSKLASIVSCQSLKVNALHHQAVKTPGEGIEIVAREMNGITQAIESKVYDFIIGVQWHPEYLIGKRRQRRLFQALVKQASVKKNK